MSELIIILISSLLSVVLAIFERNVLKRDIKKTEGRIYLGRFIIFASVAGFLGMTYNYTNFYLAPEWLLFITLILGILLISVKDKKLF